MSLLRKIPGEKFGHTYYVDSTGGNDANTGLTIGDPWQTLAKVMAVVLLPGDIVCLKAGETWTDAVSQYALQLDEYNITLTRYGVGVDPVIIGNGTDLDAFCILVSGKNVTINNVKLTTAREGAIKVTGANCHIYSCEMTATGTGARIIGASCLFHNNYAHHLTHVDTYGAVGVWLFEGADGSRIYSNVFYYCEAPYLTSVDGGACEIWGTINDIEIYKNFAIHCQGFLEVGAPVPADTVTNVKVFNNLISECQTVAIIHCGGAYETTIAGMMIEHNTSTSSMTAIAFSHAAPNYGTALVVRNNIFNGVQNFTFNGNGDNFTHEYNLYSGLGPIAPGAGEVVRTDPLLAAVPWIDMTFESNVFITGNDSEAGAESTTDATKFAVGAGGAMNGTLYGVTVTKPTGVATFSATRTVLPPTDIVELWADLWFDPNTLDMVNGDGFNIANCGISGGAPFNVFSVTFDHWGAPYRVYTAIYKDVGGPDAIASNITDAPHHLRVHVTRATTAIAADGSAEFYIDDMVIAVGTAINIDNYDIFALINGFSFGALFVDAMAGAGGTFFLDGFRTSFSPAIGTDLETDFKPVIGSPVLAAGIASSILTDYAGIARADPPTIGAYETI